MTNWQSRVRENMKALDKSNKLYQQYVEDLTAKETQLEQLFKEASELQRTNRRLEAELEKFVARQVPSETTSAEAWRLQLP